MHMADALVAPAVGGTFWAVSGALIALCCRRLRQTAREDLIPLMGVLGAFVFAAQMINFTIPGTGSSGHLGGGLLLSILLGPCAAFIVIASVLSMQALFFQDGGLLALGCNIFNLGFFPAFVAYPLIYRLIAGRRPETPRAWIATLAAAIIGLQCGALGVTVETTVSGITELPFRSFVLVMLPIHLAIGVVEGLATAAIVSVVVRVKPEVLNPATVNGTPRTILPLLAGIGFAALALGGVGSWFASTHPDGLEWAIGKITNGNELTGAKSFVHERLAHAQGKTALLPDYGFKSNAAPDRPAGEGSWPSANAGTSAAGIVGGLLMLALAGVAGVALKLRASSSPRPPG